MRGEKRIKAIERELELLEQELNLKLISEDAYAKASNTLAREIDTILYKDGKHELVEVERHIKYLQRRGDGLIKNYLVEIARGNYVKRIMDSMIRDNERAIKHSKRFRTFLLNHLKQLSKTV